MITVNGSEIKFLKDLRDKNAPKTNYYGFFPDGTPLMKFTVCADTDEVQYRIAWRYDNLTEQVILQNLVWHIQDKNPAAKITLNLPYVPNARMDRTYFEDEVAMLKNFARFINELGFYRVYILDPHSNVAAQLINRVHVDEAQVKQLIGEVIDTVNPDLLYFPDEGCQKRLKTVVQHPHIVGWKDREWKTGEILSTEILGKHKNEIKGAKILIVDDISSYGGTFIAAAEILKELGAAEIYLYVTHAENSILLGQLLTCGFINKVFTTDTIFRGTHDMVEVFTVGA